VVDCPPVQTIINPAAGGVGGLVDILVHFTDDVGGGVAYAIAVGDNPPMNLPAPGDFIGMELRSGTPQDGVWGIAGDGRWDVSGLVEDDWYTIYAGCEDSAGQQTMDWVVVQIDNIATYNVELLDTATPWDYTIPWIANESISVDYASINKAPPTLPPTVNAAEGTTFDLIVNQVPVSGVDGGTYKAFTIPMASYVSIPTYSFGAVGWLRSESTPATDGVGKLWVTPGAAIDSDVDTIGYVDPSDVLHITKGDGTVDGADAAEYEITMHSVTSYTSGPGGDAGATFMEMMMPMFYTTEETYLDVDPATVGGLAGMHMPDGDPNETIPLFGADMLLGAGTANFVTTTAAWNQAIPLGNLDMVMSLVQDWSITPAP
jgi:hypothetical protein